MRAPEDRLERIGQIERKLVQHIKGWTTGELASEFGVDPGTIRRDLSLLETMGTGLIKQGRRYILDHRRSLHNVKLSMNELLAIYLAVRLLSRHSDEHNPHVVGALEKLADALQTKSPLIARHIEQAATAVRSRHTRREYVEALEILTQGWAEGKKVRTRRPSVPLLPTSLSLLESATHVMLLATMRCATPYAPSRSNVSMKRG